MTMSRRLSIALLSLVALSPERPCQAGGPQARAHVTEPVSRPRVEVALPPTPPAGAYRWVVKALPPEDRSTPQTVSLLDGIESQVQAAHQRRIAPLIVLSEECAVGMGPHGSPDAAALFRRLVSERNRAVRALESLERDLLAQLADALELGDGPRAEIERDRLLRRRRDLLMLTCDLPPARIALEELLAPHVAGGLPAESEECLSRELIGYAEESHALHTQRVQMCLREVVDDAATFTSPLHDRTTFVLSRRKRSAPRIRVERTIVESSREWTQRIAECLGHERATRFLEAWRVRAFPKVYPNRFAIEPVISELAGQAEAPGGDDALRVLAGFAERMTEESQRMEDRCMDVWADWGATHSGSLRDREDALSAQLEKSDLRRRAIAAEAVAFLQAEALLDRLSSARRLAEVVAGL